MQLVVGTGSTWSLRVWLCATMANLELDAQVIDLSNPASKQQLAQLSPSALVPVLRDGNLAVHDSLAIVEYLNEQSGGALYPQDKSQRAIARSLCNEMHSGFFTLRSQCSFTFDSVPPADMSNQALRLELERVTAIFSQAELPFMFARPGAVDAFYAVLAYRLNSYGIRLEGKAGQYQASLLDWALMQSGIEQMRQWEREAD
ncbi:glutathione S-transferase N-terminal domain-containing protein [Vibrio tubiashii]|uniref:glutathione S-transferase N-terminal domain-containing protein n=1 Tax=Vibrio tubiashii TaxID=29498 RepID=UPI001EFCB838|nr:glutathione S-transferase N-terminal domain-containing protein [Vibrio tubiashii]MCG9581319.1 glutathione S-transferase N-terminal domain-containing protein [Vibrio tubiashii]MCG9614910.1 glutathione S-transferase N-terminal domain-containing protein [Vibrio tubiashii]MCG9689252.1 glutathione S-transferase N-terminal domain-containing protein [Vibrio tubiashii]